MLTSMSRLVLLCCLVRLSKSQECDPVFDAACKKKPEPVTDPVFGPSPVTPNSDPVFGPSPGNGKECYNINDVDSNIFSPDTRQAVNVCEPGDCSEYADRGYSCAPIWTCKNSRIITDGKGIIDVRTTVEEEEEGCVRNSGTIDVSDKKCPKTDEVCCKNPNFRANHCEPDVKPPVDGEEKDDWNKCGRNGTGTLTLSGSDDPTLAQPGEFPHMCIIYRVVSGQRVYVSGASLIAPNKLLTVAHKFWVVNKGKTVDHRGKIRSGNSEFYARCGEHNVKAEDELLDAQETVLIDIKIHPDYNKKRVTNNLAILLTEENFVYKKHVGPVCLPRPGENFEGQTDCWSSGWGADAYDSNGYFSDTLKMVQMPIVEKSVCERQFQAHERFKGKNFKIHSSWICVGGEEDSDTCKGDGGSPHVCFTKDNKYVQVGSVAWGVGCGEEIPAVYSNVAGGMCWIDWVMSCSPLADFNIDDTFNGDIRNSQVESINGLTEDECKSWLNKNPKLKDECEVSYSDIDNRST